MSRRILWPSWAVMIATPVELQHTETDPNHLIACSFLKLRMTLAAFPDSKHSYLTIPLKKQFCLAHLLYELEIPFYTETLALKKMLFQTV